MSTTKRRTAAQKLAAQQRAAKAALKSFYDSTQSKERDDKKAMMSLITSIKDVIKRHRDYIDAAVKEYALVKEDQKKREQEEKELENALNDDENGNRDSDEEGDEDSNEEGDEDSSEEDHEDNKKRELEELKKENQKSLQWQFERCDCRLRCYVQSLMNFDENWLTPFMQVYEGELELLSLFDIDTLNAQRNDEVDNQWLPSLRSLLYERKIPIPPILYTLSKTYAYLTYGYKFFGDEFRGGHARYRSGEANAFGSIYVWDDDDRDTNHFRMFLSAPEPYLSLQVYSRQNYIVQGLPYSLGGGNKLTTENKKKLAAMKNWLKLWSDARESRKRNTTENHDASDDNGINRYKPPRKKIYTESTYKLDTDRFYMKCPGCDYIVVFPKPLPSFVNEGVKRKDGSDDSLWLMGKSGAHKLDLSNCKFSSDFKKRHSYKVMQSHVARCEKCPFPPDCFGKPRQQQDPETEQVQAQQMVTV